MTTLKSLKDWPGMGNFSQSYNERVFLDDTLIGDITSVNVTAWQGRAEKPWAPGEYEPTSPKEWGGTFNVPVEFHWIGRPVHLRIDGVLIGEIVMETETAFLGIGAPHPLR